jgi:hypothetical protein
MTQKSLDDTLDTWLDIAKQKDGHIYWLPNSKKVINGLCLQKDPDQLLKVYVQLQEIYEIVKAAACCDYLGECNDCNRRNEFLQLLTRYMKKIKSSVNT